jgi:hypothetical protein
VSTSLISTSGTKFEIALAPEAEALKLAALATAKGIVRVDSFTEQDAVDALKGINDIRKQVEKSRKDAKAPALEFGKKVDDLAKRFNLELDAEANRISTLLSAHEEEKRRVAAEAEAKRQEEERKIHEEAMRKAEAERKAREDAEAELAKAKNAKARADAEAKLKASQEASAKLAAEEAKRLDEIRKSKPVEAEKAVGTVVREVWTFEVTDIHALYRHDPKLCRMEPNTSAINVAIGGGDRDIPGLVIRRETKVGTR